MDEDSLISPFLISFLRSAFAFVFVLPLLVVIPAEKAMAFQDVTKKHLVESKITHKSEKNTVDPLRTTTNPYSIPKQESVSKTKRVKLPRALVKKSKKFHPIIVKAADRHQVDSDLVKAIIMAESGYNPQAISKYGAKGLMQLMPRTAKALGVKDSFDPVHNINGGVKYLKQLLGQFNHNVKFALAAYNAGSAKVRKHKGIPPIKATHCFIRKVFEYYHYYKNETASETGNV